MGVIPKRHFIIIGGGISGMAAAWYLRKAGHEVTLLEARAHLGGRLSSHETPDTPTPFDNGPHLFLSSYTATRQLFRGWGIADSFVFPYPGAIPFVGMNGARGTLREWPLPAPFNFTAGLLAFPLLTWAARRRIIRAARKLLESSELANQSAQQWLDANSSSEERTVFWEPPLRAALNAPAADVPCQHLRIVLREGFCQGIFGGRLGYAREPLGEIFDGKVRAALTQAGVRIIIRAAATGAEVVNGAIAAILLRDGSRLPCDGVVAALPPWALTEWLKGVPQGEAIAGDYCLPEWRSHPITTLYLWADNRPLLEGFTCLPGRQAAWVFDFARLWGDRRAPVGVIVDEVALGTHRGQGPFLGGAPLQILDDFIAAFPQLGAVRWLHGRMVSEKRATPLRPRELWGKTLPQTTAIPNLFLAGDWLDPDLPPTVEGGVRRGEIIAYAKDFA